MCVTSCNGMSDLLQRSISSAAQIETRFPMRLDPVLVDANQLELALLNLVVNARDAMPDGGTITISARSGDASNVKAASGSFVCVSVTDTGQGMDEATLARAVEPFFTTKGVGKGTGLGLSMVHGLAEQCGGRLVLTSQKGRGTTAELWLPIAEVESPGVVPDRASEDSGQSARALRIMVVDDDSLVLSNTAAMLEDLGHEVIEATSGEQALRILRRSGAVDLLITDQMMPGIRGTQLIEAVRSEWPDLKVILATGYAETAIREATMCRGSTNPSCSKTLPEPSPPSLGNRMKLVAWCSFGRGERGRYGCANAKRGAAMPAFRVRLGGSIRLPQRWLATSLAGLVKRDQALAAHRERHIPERLFMKFGPHRVRRGRRVPALRNRLHGGTADCRRRCRRRL